MPSPREQIRFCTSADGTRIAYATCGAGPALVWVAPFSHSLELDWDNIIWQPWLSLLTRYHSLVRYDWRGCGLSDRDGVEFSFEKHLEDLESIVNAAGPKQFVLVGHEGAGMVCVAYAVRHPTKVSQLVLIGSSTRGRTARAATPEQMQDVETRRKMVELSWNNDAPAFRRFHANLHIPDGSPEQQEAFDHSLHETTTPHNAERIIRTFSTSDVRSVAAKVNCPTLVLHAREDSIISFEEGRAIAALIPGARFVSLESRNHDVLITEPAWQQMVEALYDFLPAHSEHGHPAALNELTAREREVLEIVAQGADNTKIAALLKISEKTVRNHVSLIFSKLGVNSRAEAVARARDAGFGRRHVP
jgi:pimeloyl-ACP methyl ester carboxylesterase/DNA-binding CsgD family transcriptional regulator